MALLLLSLPACAAKPYVKIVNNTDKVTFCHLYIAAPGSGYWENDLLAGAQVAPGASQSVTVDSGTYDLKVSDCDGSNEITRNAQDLSSPLVWTLDQATGPSTINIANQTQSFTFCYLYASTDTTNWGDDLLQGTQIKPGETVPVTIVNPGIFNLKLEDCDHANPVMQQAQDFSVPATTLNWTVTENIPSPTDKVTLTVHNKSSDVTLCYLYLAPTDGSTPWGEDMLKGAQIGPGGIIDLKLTPGIYKAKVLDCAKNSRVENDNLTSLIRQPSGL